MNWLQLSFAVLFVTVSLLGYVSNSASSVLPQPILAFFHYGRAIKDLKQAGVVKLLQVPKSWFAHFYAYAVVLQFSVFYTFLNIVGDPNPRLVGQKSWIADILHMLGAGVDSRVGLTTSVYVSALFLLHLLRRLYENCFVSVFSGTKMNVCHYGVAFFHYTGCIFGILAHTCCFANDNQSCKAFNFDDLNLWDWLAIALFVYGSWEQHRAHKSYANLRKGKDKVVVSLEHKIPTGGMFEIVSCPNYWAELIIYCSICFMFRFANPTWNTITLWVVGNQITSGVMNHKWYLRTFPNYPKHRRAIIPYVL